jgi:gliding motility-associated-like protein
MYLPKPARKYLLVLTALLSFFIPGIQAKTLTVNNATPTKAVNIAGKSYVYNLVKDKPGKLTKTINPARAATPTITTSTTTGTIYACAGSASASPQLQQFTVTGNNLTGNITATAPAGFELSPNAASGYGAGITLTQTGGTVSNTIVYVRSAASAATGNISGNVTLSSAGSQNQTVAVTGIVNPLPTVNQVTNQTVINGAATTAINFSGTGNALYNWVNDTPGIGLPATGSGNIGSFTAVNNGTSPATATITATPVSGGFAYITNSGDGTISVINVATNMIVSTITPPHDPFCVCISPDGSKAYIGCSGGTSTVTVINTLTNAILNTIPVSSSGESTGITVSPDGTMLYVANYVDNTVSAVTIATGAVDVIPVGQYPYGIAISPDGSKVYVAFTYSNYISVISTANNTVTANITVGLAPQAMAVSQDGSKVYVPVSGSNNIAVIDPTTNKITTVIPLGASPVLIALSPDGTRAYVATTSYSTYPYSSSIVVVNTSTHAVLSTIAVGAASNGISVSPDGHFVYVTNTESNNVSVINTSTNTVIATVRVGISPLSLGNFVTGGTGCSGTPTTFTIAVNPSPTPTITAGNISGSIYSCLGTASVSPNIQQFTVSGNNLTSDINAAAPAGFEISTSLNGGYANTLTLTESGGTVSTSTIYVRTAATATAGSLTGQVTLTAPGAPTINAAVQGKVYDAAVVNVIQPQTVTNGLQTSAIDFTGTATNYNWVNDTPTIGLAASGSGNIVSFTAINTGSAPVIATITITPVTSGGASEGNITCTGTPITLTITVNPTPRATITAEGTLQPLTTTYGTPSSSTILNISGTLLTEGILVTPPAGFEESTDNSTFGKALTMGTSGNISTTPVYIRLAATTPVGEYSDNMILSSRSITPVDVALPVSTVNPALLTLIADNKSKFYGAVNPVLTASYTGFVNNETPAVLTAPSVLTTTAITLSAVGQYPITANGAKAFNYSINYINGLLTVMPAEQDTFIPNTFTPNGDGINDTWNIKFLDSNCSVNIVNRWGQNVFTSIGYGIPWDGTYKGTPLPAGTYYYIINLKNGDKVLAGYVAIMR